MATKHRTDPPTIDQIATLFQMGKMTLAGWKKDGTDIYDARAIMDRIAASGRPPHAWREWTSKRHSTEVKANPVEADENTHAHWKMAKDKEMTLQLRLKNSKLAGEMFERADGEGVQLLWASMLQTKVNELTGTWPQACAGMDEAELETFLKTEFHKMLTDMADLESAAWSELFKRYDDDNQGPPADDAAGAGDPTTQTPKRKRVVRRKRHADTRSDT